MNHYKFLFVLFVLVAIVSIITNIERNRTVDRLSRQQENIIWQNATLFYAFAETIKEHAEADSGWVFTVNRKFEWYKNRPGLEKNELAITVWDSLPGYVGWFCNGTVIFKNKGEIAMIDPRGYMKRNIETE